MSMSRANKLKKFNNLCDKALFHINAAMDMTQIGKGEYILHPPVVLSEKSLKMFRDAANGHAKQAASYAKNAATRAFALYPELRDNAVSTLPEQTNHSEGFKANT